MKKYDVYVAGPFFNQEQVEVMEKLEDILRKNGFKMFMPRIDSVNLGLDKSEEAKKKAFEDDVNAIEESSFVIANTMNKDLGTLFEVGYAYKAGVPIIGLAYGLPDGAPFNIMLAGAMKAVFTTLEQVENFFNGFIDVDDTVEWLYKSETSKYEGEVE